jgi:hypothetical protein
MQLELNQGEAELVQRVLTNYLGDLRMEIRDTDSYDFRQGLKEDEQSLRSILERFGAAARSSTV